jgi:hypothetical protein
MTVLSGRSAHELDSWAGIGRIAVGMAHQGFDLQLTRYAERGWRANFYPSGLAHSVVKARDGRRHRGALQRAAWETVRKGPGDEEADRGCRGAPSVGRLAMIDEQHLPDFSGKVIVLYIRAAPAAIQISVVLEYAEFRRYGGRLVVVGRQPSVPGGEWTSNVESGVAWDEVVHWVVFPTREAFLARVPASGLWWRRFGRTCRWPSTTSTYGPASQGSATLPARVITRLRHLAAFLVSERFLGVGPSGTSGGHGAAAWRAPIAAESFGYRSGPVSTALSFGTYPPSTPSTSSRRRSDGSSRT